MNARELARQVTRTGALALPIAALGAVVVGVAWGHATDGGIAVLVRNAPELIGPVVALLFLAAPLGAAQAGELGALRSGEQIAWLQASGRSVFATVVAARVAAVAIVAPLAALVAAFALLGATAFEIASQDAAVASIASITPARVFGGALRAAVGGTAIAAVACAAGLASQAGVARSAALGAAASLLVAAGLGLAWLAQGAA